jgi:ribosomal-protein-alanine N-acetyltransferase
VRLRSAKVEDIPAMMALEQQCPGAAHWSRQQYEKLFPSENVPQPSKRFAWVAEDGEPPAIVGFLVSHNLVSHNIDQEWELENIAVAEPERRRGVGTLLLSQLSAHARNAGGTEIFLEVRESNQNARALYSRLGFQEQGSRKSYYSNPTEEAVLYRVKL